MTVEEIERILQTVTEKHAQLAEAQIDNEARFVELREIVRQIAVDHKSIVELISLHEKRLDGHDDAARATDDKLNALINAQVGLEDRQAKLDEIAGQIAVSHGSIIELIRLHEKRLDGHDLAAQTADDKLNVLTDAQARYEDRQAKLDESHLLLVQLVRIQDGRIDGHDGAFQHINGRLDALMESPRKTTKVAKKKTTKKKT